MPHNGLGGWDKENVPHQAGKAIVGHLCRLYAVIKTSPLPQTTKAPRNEFRGASL